MRFAYFWLVFHLDRKSYVLAPQYFKITKPICLVVLLTIMFESDCSRTLVVIIDTYEYYASVTCCNMSSFLPPR